MKPYIHTVNYYETDKMGITHHSNYIRFMEEARVDFLSQIGYGFEKLEADGIVSPVTAITFEYKRATTFPQEISIVLSVEKCSPIKLVFGYTMTVNSKAVGTATSTHCFLENGKIISLETRYPDLYKLLKEMETEK